MIDLVVWLTTLLVLTGVIETGNGYATWIAGIIISMGITKTTIKLVQGFLLNRRMEKCGPIDATPMGDIVTHIRTKEELQEWLGNIPEGDNK